MFVPPKLVYSEEWTEWSVLTRACCLAYTLDKKYDPELDKYRPLTEEEAIEICRGIANSPRLNQATSLGIYTLEELSSGYYDTTEGLNKARKKLYQLTNDYVRSLP